MTPRDHPRGGGAFASRVEATEALPPRRRPGLFGRGFVSVPLRRRVPRGLGSALALGFFAAVAAAGLGAGGHLQSFREAFGEPHHALARWVGFDIERITIAGVAELRESEILAGAGITPQVSLAFLDAAEVRRRLEAMPLIKQAAVRKLYPDELTITLVEREPAALWQEHGKIAVIAADGTVIDRLRDERFRRLPLVVGEGANLRLRDYADLTDAAGPLRGRIRAGMLVAGRRWTLKLDGGVEVKLPERGAKEALARFAAVEREQRLTERDILAIDMRLPDRIVIRVSEEAGEARADVLRKKPKAAKGGDT